MRIDADAAFKEAADAGALMPVQMAPGGNDYGSLSNNSVAAPAGWV